MIKLEAVHKGYLTAQGRQDVLRDINLEVGSGEMVALLGPSGCGKTTTMNIMGALDTPSSGRCWVNGQDIQVLSDRERAAFRNEVIGFVFQQFYLLPRLSVQENIALPTLYSRDKTADVSARVKVLMQQLAIEDLAAKTVSQLSGGQMQRVAIARALVNRPKIILADEPTGSLDQRNGRKVMDLILNLNREQKITGIIVTHDPQVAAMCDRVVTLRDGRIEDEG